MRNDVWLHGVAGRGAKVDVVANQNEDETKTVVKQKNTHYVQDTAARAVTGRPVCVRHGCEYGVVGTAMTSTEVSDELHRLAEKKRGKHWIFEQQKA